MTGQELTKLWELYPEARNLYEQYNGILVEDDPAWKELTAYWISGVRGLPTAARS